ncbi:hypothetical protein BU198_06695 [Streptomyces sp. CBMA156]|nr:hypothetical protein [Streptomyces sp. CBMA156]
MAAKAMEERGEAGRACGAGSASVKQASVRRCGGWGAVYHQPSGMASTTERLSWSSGRAGSAVWMAIRRW